MKINRYKLSDRVSKENRGALLLAGFRSGSWRRKDNHDWMSASMVLYDEITIEIDIDLTTLEWDDFNNVLVLDCDFGQPYVPFYHYLNGEIKMFPVLEKVVKEYNRLMEILVSKGIFVPAETKDKIEMDSNVLHIVAVGHKTGQEKRYWFEVPEKLVPLIKSGTKVLCNTRYGQQSGIAKTEVLSGDEVKQLAEIEGAKFPLNQIVAVRQDVPMYGIKIGRYLTGRLPSKSKMIERLDEFYDIGVFRTKVVIDDEGWLLDGYSAYLVAKMFGMNSIPVATWA